MKTKKILRIITRLNIGGPAIHVILLTNGLDLSKFRTLLVSGIIGDGEADMFYFAQENKTMPIIIPELKREIDLICDFKAIARTFYLIRNYNPDLIHTHTAKAGTIGRLAGILYKTLFNNNVKLVHTFHGHALEGYFGKLKTHIFITIERILAAFTDRIIVVSESVRDELLNFKICKEEKISVINLGLELEKFIGVDFNLKLNEINEENKIGIVGRLVRIKNHKMFFDAVKLLIDRYHMFNNKIIIIGDGDQRKNLEDYVNGLGLRERVEFIGWQKDLEKIYPKLDIVCLTSLNEGTPVSLIEAMAAARPVIATNVGGVKDLLGPVCKKIGLSSEKILIKSNDVEGFAEGLKLLLDNESLRLKIGEAGREFVRNRFTKERLIKDMEMLYNNLLSKR